MGAPPVIIHFWLACFLINHQLYWSTPMTMETSICGYIQGQSILESASFTHESVFDLLNRKKNLRGSMWFFQLFVAGCWKPKSQQRYPLVNKHRPWKSPIFYGFTSLPTPTTARVYVNLPEGTTAASGQVLHEDHWAFPRQTFGVSRRWEHPVLIIELGFRGWEFTKRYGDIFNGNFRILKWRYCTI